MRQKTAILLAVAWVFSQVGGVSAVLCIGDDGAVSVESSVGSKCGCPQEERADLAPAFRAQGKHCRDIPLAAASPAKAQDRYSGPFLPPVGPSAAVAPEASASEIALSRIAPWRCTYFLPLEFIVLVI